MLVGILEEIEDLLQLEFGLVNAGDVPEADPVLGTWAPPGLARRQRIGCGEEDVREGVRGRILLFLELHGRIRRHGMSDVAAAGEQGGGVDCGKTGAACIRAKDLGFRLEFHERDQHVRLCGLSRQDMSIF